MITCNTHDTRAWPILAWYDSSSGGLMWTHGSIPKCKIVILCSGFKADTSSGCLQAKASSTTTNAARKAMPEDSLKVSFSFKRRKRSDTDF